MLGEEIKQDSLFSVLRHGPLKVAVLGSGNWGTAVGAIISENAQECYLLSNEVTMWVHDEVIRETGKTLSATINEQHENVKYLPGFSLPKNLKANPSVEDTVKDADLIVLILPHQFVETVAERIRHHIKPSARAITLVKGLHVEDGKPYTFSRVLESLLGIEVCALSGANVAQDVAKKQFCETTIGYKVSETATIWQQVFNRPYFRVHMVPDPEGVQVCGAVKNLIALAAGFCDGMELGSNTKAAIIRIGVEEMKVFASVFFEGVLEDTFFDSAGFADVITTCYGGRNVRCAAEFIRRKQECSWEEIENEMLRGMKMQGQLTCKEVHQVLETANIMEYFPLFNVTYDIAFNKRPPEALCEIFTTAPPTQIKTPMDCSKCLLPPQLAQIRNLIHKDGSTPLSRSGDRSSNRSK